MNRDPELDLALRRNRGRRLVSEWLARFRTAAEYEPAIGDFLGLEDTMRLKQRFVEILRSRISVKRCSVPAFSHETMFGQLKSWNPGGPPRVVLFSSLDQYIGGLQLPPDVVFARAKDIWGVVGEDLSMCSEDLSHGFCLELNYYDEADRYVADGVYQMIGWGVFSVLHSR
jgi:hypothetical protein